MEEKKVDVKGLLDLADELNDTANSYQWQCPHYIKTWVVSARLDTTARLIREFVGEE